MNKTPILPVLLEEEMKRSYLDYAMSVIVSRALPDVRDGLKPVHRRILYSMHESGLDYNKPYRKSARVVGDVMGKYHPHGDAAIYNAMARMAQDFSMRVELVDGQGNYGSMDGDQPAAMRYTEARLSQPAHYLLQDIDKDTVEFVPNYDNSVTEPSVLPTRFPNLLVNGAGGIAVGMATNIPSHNLGEVLDACCYLIDHPEATFEDLLQYLPGPDFPTGGIICGSTGIHQAYKTGKGSVVIRAKTAIEELKTGRKAIIVSEIPFQVNKARMLERIAEVVNAKIVEGISDLRDESDRDGVRVVIELKRDTEPSVILNQLFKHTPLQTSFGINMLALNKGRPMLMTIKDILKAFLEFRVEIITRRAQFDLKKARDKAHILVGLAVCVVNLDAIISLIRSSKDAAEARKGLMENDWPVQDIGPLLRMVDPDFAGDDTYSLSETQAKAILDLRLHRLTGLERDKITSDLKQTFDEIQAHLRILSDKGHLLSVLKEELLYIKEKFSTARRTNISDINIHASALDLIQQEDMVVTVSHGGYIKRVPLDTYRAQRRGGKGRSGMSTREDDFVEQLFVASTHTHLLFFTNYGRVYDLEVYKIPAASATSRGKALVNLLPLQDGEKVSTIMPLPEDTSLWETLYVLLVTSSGYIRKNRLSDFSNIRANGKIAMKLQGEETLVQILACDDDGDVLISTYKGKCIRFSVSDLRTFASRNSHGVRAIKLLRGDYVISIAPLTKTLYSTEERDQYLRLRKLVKDASEVDKHPEFSLSAQTFEDMANKEEFVLTIAEKGYGKRTSSYDYRCTNRGGQGIANMEITEKTGSIVSSFPVVREDQVMLVTTSGQLIRCNVDNIRIASRKTQGVKVLDVKATERVVSVDRISEEAPQESEE